MISSISIINQNNLEYVPLPHVLYQLEVAAERDKDSRRLQITKVLNDLLQEVLKHRCSFDRGDKLHADGVISKFVSKISEIQSGD
uniref:Uncharacterized protein n=1 Tax=Pseudomonas phage HRDY3 TaxID=3236930 RepID=A0AB39CE34_9VIRU